MTSSRERQPLDLHISCKIPCTTGYLLRVCDFISDSVLDAHLAQDPAARVACESGLDFRPAAIIDRFDLRRPIYRSTTNYGHFGRPELPWEQD